MILLGYLFTILNYVCYCLSRFMKHKISMLLLNLVSKILMIFALYCFNSLSGAYMFFVIFIMLIVVNIKEYLNKQWTIGYIFFQIVYFAILFYTYAGISSILITITASISLFYNWWLPPQQMRLLGGISDIIYLSYQISIKNWAGLLEIFAIISNFGAFIKYKKIK